MSAIVISAPKTFVEIIVAKNKEVPADLKAVCKEWKRVSGSTCFDIHQAQLLDELDERQINKLLSMMRRGEIYTYEDKIISPKGLQVI